MEQPTIKQFRILLVLNPFEFNRTYKDAAAVLGISETCVKSRMARLKKQCPVIYKNFRKAVMDNKVKVKHPISIYEDVIPKEQFDVPKISFKMKNKCKCGIKIPDGQGACYGCWRRKDRKKNPKIYRRDLMYPTNGPTPNTIDFVRRFKDVNKDFTVDDLPIPTDLTLEELL